MKTNLIAKLVFAAACFATCCLSVQAQIPGLYITEVNPSGSGNLNYAADWFELTNTSASVISLVGWKMDDNSNSFGSAVGLRGVTSINPGQSIIFFEGNATGTTDATIAAAFNSAWGTSLVFGSTIGAYGGSGVGLSSSGDAVNIYDAGGALRANVSFGAATSLVSFDNTALLNNTSITQLSVAGTNGAFLSSINEIGSPGYAAIPEPSTYALMLGLGALGVAAFRRKRAQAA